MGKREAGGFEDKEEDTNGTRERIDRETEVRRV